MIEEIEHRHEFKPPEDKRNDQRRHKERRDPGLPINHKPKVGQTRRLLRLFKIVVLRLVCHAVFLCKREPRKGIFLVDQPCVKVGDRRQGAHENKQILVFAPPIGGMIRRHADREKRERADNVTADRIEELSGSAVLFENAGDVSVHAIKHDPEIDQNDPDQHANVVVYAQKSASRKRV